MQGKLLEETSVVVSGNWTARIHPPAQPWNNRLVLLLHGWTGDENIMWIFARKLSIHCYVVAPRAPLTSPEGGYAWAIPVEGKRPGIETYLDQCQNLLDHFPGWIPNLPTDYRLDVIGFSQGAAMAYAMSLAACPAKIAPLAGYLPPGLEEKLESKDLSTLKLFIAHNTDDIMVPVDESRRAVGLFKSQGAQVEYCENKGGHKVSTACFNALDNFLRE